MENIFMTIVIMAVVLVGVCFLKRYIDRKNQFQYDERQLLMQKKAYTNAAWTALFFNLIIWIEGDNLARYFSLSFVGLATFYLIVGVFVSNSILLDAYFGKFSGRRFVMIYFLMLVLFALAFIRQLYLGTLLDKGHLYLTGENSTPLLFSLTFGEILLVTIYKSIKNKKEEYLDKKEMED